MSIGLYSKRYLFVPSGANSFPLKKTLLLKGVNVQENKLEVMKVVPLD